MRRIGGLITIFFAALVAATPAHGVIDQPDDLALWLAQEGIAAVLSSSDAPDVEATDINIGVASQVWTWSPSFLDGNPGEDVIVETDWWAAPIAVQGELSGVVVVDMAENSTIQLSVQWSSQFGRAAGSTSYTLVHDEALDAWFTLNMGEVRPLSENAHEVLSGPLEVGLLQDFVREWNGMVDEAETAEPEEPVEASNLVYMTALAVVAVLTVVGVIVAVRKEGARA